MEGKVPQEGGENSFLRTASRKGAGDGNPVEGEGDGSVSDHVEDPVRDGRWNA